MLWCYAGTISVQELEQVLASVGGSDPKEIKDILEKVDKNKDGQIDYEEFVEMMTPPAAEPVRTRKNPAIKF